MIKNCELLKTVKSNVELVFQGGEKKKIKPLCNLKYTKFEVKKRQKTYRENHKISLISLILWKKLAQSKSKIDKYDQDVHSAVKKILRLYQESLFLFTFFI